MRSYKLSFNIEHLHNLSDILNVYTDIFYIATAIPPKLGPAYFLYG